MFIYSTVILDSKGRIKMRFEILAKTCEELSEKDSRNEKIKITSNFLKGLDRDDLRRACRMIIGRPFPRSSQSSTNLSKKSILNALSRSLKTEKYDEYYAEYGDFGEVIRRLMMEARTKQSVLTGEKVDLESIQAFLDKVSRIGGEGSRKKRDNLADVKFSQISPLEGKYLAKLLLGRSRHGISDGIVVHAIAEAWGRPVERVRRACLLTGDLGEAATMSKMGKLDQAEIEYQRPFLPMLAEMADEAADVVEEMGHCLCEEKLDGVRIQVHRGKNTELYTRNLNRVTEKFLDVVEEFEDFDEEFIAEGELIAERDGSVLPFQRLMRRFREKADENLVKEIPVRIYFFDLLKLGEDSLVDEELRDRGA
ncbi:hypothetical protein AKJ58_00905 [candidate division MSBL1 archaeon SCGC-AAA385D11]|uniref:ATP-dependent DNA ligase family profile domain-containing protein n=1 Tax=candidate division MSBL1 archaeon SCGC-AAA385D11 TaxID=1698286 RepID=A0A133VNQ2_9EURY|nr:hypothetical protein AKJ58_00905 [candidate division MSBL1 archaeon SCGC-AAA385D11]